MNKAIVCALALFCSCALGKSPESDYSPIFIAVAKFHYSPSLGKVGLIARLSIDGKDPSPRFLKEINEGIVGYFTAISDLQSAKHADNFRELNFGEVKKDGSNWYVYAMEGVFPPANAPLRFTVVIRNEHYVVVRGERLIGFTDEQTGEK